MARPFIVLAAIQRFRFLVAHSKCIDYTLVGQQRSLFESTEGTVSSLPLPLPS